MGSIGSCPHCGGEIHAEWERAPILRVGSAQLDVDNNRVNLNDWSFGPGLVGGWTPEELVTIAYDLRTLI